MKIELSQTNLDKQLNRAALNGDISEIKLLLKQGASLKGISSMLLEKIIYKNDSETLKILLDAGLPLNFEGNLITRIILTRPDNKGMLAFLLKHSDFERIVNDPESRQWISDHASRWAVDNINEYLNNT
jgi:hypothetical protein